MKASFLEQSEYYQEWKKELKLFPERTTFHGFQFFFDSNKSWIERMLWFGMVAWSWGGAVILMSAQYSAFYYNPISFVVETTYSEWNTNFASVVVCETENTDLLESMADRLWPGEHDFNLEEVLKEVVFFRGDTYYSERFCIGNNTLPGCLTNNLSSYALMGRSKCKDLLNNCTWNNEEFDCCKYFTLIETEFGVCHAINSIQGMEANPPRLNMNSNRTTGPGVLKFAVAFPANIYILHEEEVPSYLTRKSDILYVIPQVYYKREMIMRNIENDPAARGLSPERRKCRYKDENSHDVYRFYSYTACTLQCRKDAQLKLCGCCNFMMPHTSESEKCNMSNLRCLDEVHGVEKFSVIRASWSNKAGLVCDCLPSCTEAEIAVVKDTMETLDENDENGLVEIVMSALPSERYRRKVVRDILDLVVAMGGTAGLFMGASLLSFIELFYLLFLRCYCGSTIYRWAELSDKWHHKYGNRKLEQVQFGVKSTKIEKLNQ